VVSFFIHESLSLGADTLIWGTKLKATLLYVLFNNPSVWIETLVYILFLLSFSLMEYRRMSQENEIRCSQLEVQIIRSKLQEIRSKIQPTFLFNTLQTILELIRTHRNKDANHILSLLSDFLRTTVYDNERDEITLEEEMRFLNQYLEIEKVRSSYTFSVHEDIERCVSNAVVPNFILQPIVEELVYRNFGQNTTQHEIVIRAYKAEEQLEVMIEDHGIETTGSLIGKEEKGIVLDITKERLLHLYGDQQNLTVQLTREGGVLVKIRVPFREMNIESEGTLVVESAL
jgi:LytS/YehU family sensor histidine kinase